MGRNEWSIQFAVVKVKTHRLKLIRTKGLAAPELI
jgi:hypothetical protein